MKPTKEDPRTAAELLAGREGKVYTRPAAPAVEAPAAPAAPAGRWDRVTSWTPPTTRPPPPSWLLWPGAAGAGRVGMMRRGKVALLSARGGTGKTAALCGLALAVASGKPWLQEPAGRHGDGAGFGVDPSAAGQLVALLLGEEDKDEINRRLLDAAEMMGLDASKLRELSLVVGPLDGVQVPLVQAAEAGHALNVEDLVERLETLAKGRPYAAVLVDPLSRFGGPECEIDNHAATLAITALERLTKLPGFPAVVVAHHERKGGGAGADAVRGASGLTDGARWVARLEHVLVEDEGRTRPYRTSKGRGMVRFEVVKSNYAPAPEPRLLVNAEGALRVAQSGEVEEYREAVGLAAAERKASKASKAERAAERKAGKAGPGEV